MFAALQRDKAGISLVELVVAVALLSLVSLAAVQLLNMTERTMVGSQVDMNQQLRSESIAAFIYKDFSRGELGDNVISRTYTNAIMPEDLQGGAGVAIYGLKNREGTWFSVPSEPQKCDATREHSICGYYVE